MNNSTLIRLREVAQYSSTRISCSELTPRNYIGTDNLLQNKLGKTDALYTPDAGATTGYSNGDILIGNIRPYLKKIWHATNTGGSSADVLTLKVNNGIDSKFVYYTLHRDDFFTHMMKGSKGTKMPRGDKPQVLDFLIPDFDITTQQKISSILSVLDSKIEVNNNINAELEQMAKTLYDYWFVQFDFPDQNGKPYKTSGGKMVWSEELKREIPEGWKINELSEIITRSSTGLNPRNNFKLGSGNNFYVTIKNINNGKIILDDKCDKIDDEALKIINNRSDLRPGDILFTSIEPVGITYFIHTFPPNWNINESVFTLRPNYRKITSEYLYMLLSSPEMKAFTKNCSTGSIHKGIRHGILKTFKLPYSDKTLIDNFSSYISPILKRINNLDIENQKLSELRDWLLPMLMNGQITVE